MKMYVKRRRCRGKRKIKIIEKKKTQTNGQFKIDRGKEGQRRTE